MVTCEGDIKQWEDFAIGELEKAESAFRDAGVAFGEAVSAVKRVAKLRGAVPANGADFHGLDRKARPVVSEEVRERLSKLSEKVRSLSPLVHKARRHGGKWGDCEGCAVDREVAALGVAEVVSAPMVREPEKSGLDALSERVQALEYALEHALDAVAGEDCVHGARDSIARARQLLRGEEQAAEVQPAGTTPVKVGQVRRALPATVSVVGTRVYTSPPFEVLALADSGYVEVLVLDESQQRRTSMLRAVEACPLFPEQHAQYGKVPGYDAQVVREGTPQRTRRGFRIFAGQECTDEAKCDEVSVVESSRACEGPHVRIYSRVCEEHVELSLAAAEAALAGLRTFVAEARAGLLTEKVAD